jgi:hypothetical protein
VKLVGDLELAGDPVIIRTVNELGTLIEDARKSKNDDRTLMKYYVCSTSSPPRSPPPITTGGDAHKPECYLEQVLNSAVIENELKPLPGFFHQVMHKSNYYSEPKPRINYFFETGRNQQAFEIADSSTLFPVWKFLKVSNSQYDLGGYRASYLTFPCQVSPQTMTFFILATLATPTNDSITAFQTSASIIRVLDNIRNLPHFCRQDTASRKLLQNTVIMLTLGPSISDGQWAALLSELSVPQSQYTVRPKTIKVQHRNIDIIITSVTDERYHTTNETLLLVKRLRENGRKPVPALVFVEPKGMNSKVSVSVWDGIEVRWVSDTRKAATRIRYGKQ